MQNKRNVQDEKYEKDETKIIKSKDTPERPRLDVKIDKPVNLDFVMDVEIPAGDIKRSTFIEKLLASPQRNLQAIVRAIQPAF